MLVLYHYPLSPFSRIVRLMLGEYGENAELREEHAWERRPEFLSLNPAGEVPVLIDGDEAVVSGATVIAEYFEETRGPAGSAGRLMPTNALARAEVRRLVDWFNVKFNDEVTRNLVVEKIDRRFMPRQLGGGSPEVSAVRAGLANIRHHLKYVGYLIGRRNWLAGDQITYADLAAAAHLSCVDYLGDVPWDVDQTARDWYARIKSRPAFRPLLSDHIAGMPPPPAYADLDF